MTDSIPYPELLKGKIKPFKFNVMVVNDDYRPQFDSPIKSSLKNLTERCWSKYPEERPTFENIFKKLANNIDDSIDDLYDQSNSEDENDDDNKYYLDDVKFDDIAVYIEDMEFIESQMAKVVVEDDKNRTDSGAEKM